MKLLVVVFFVSCVLSLHDTSPIPLLEHGDFADLGRLVYILTVAKNILAVKTIRKPAIPGQAQTETLNYVSVNRQKSSISIPCKLLLNSFVTSLYLKIFAIGRTDWSHRTR